MAQSVYAPDYLRDRDEVWHERPDGVPMWSENYLSGACFPRARAGVWLHQSRPQHDPRFWEEIFTFALPDGRVLLSKGATLAAPGGNGAVGPGLSYDCIEPYRRWRKSFHGLARLVDGDLARLKPLEDGPHLAVDMDLEWECVGPPFDMDMSEQVWADVKAHYQQHCRVRGTIQFDGERLELDDGIGMRDHSWGPRDLTGLGRHTWVYGEFPSGRRVMYFFHTTASGHGRLDVGHEVLGDDWAPLSAADDPIPPRRPSEWSEPWSMEFQRADGSTATMRGEILAGIPLAMTGGSELQLGAPGPEASHFLFECPSSLQWDGETGFGITEWTWRTDE